MDYILDATTRPITPSRSALQESIRMIFHGMITTNLTPTYLVLVIKEIKQISGSDSKAT